MADYSTSFSLFIDATPEERDWFDDRMQRLVVEADGAGARGPGVSAWGHDSPA